MNFREVLKVCQRSLKGAQRKFLGWFKEVPRVFQESFKGVSRKLQELQECSLEFYVGFKGA